MHDVVSQHQSSLRKGDFLRSDWMFRREGDLGAGADKLRRRTWTTTAIALCQRVELHAQSDDWIKIE